MMTPNPEHPIFIEDPSAELLSEASNSKKAWVYRAMDQRVIPKYTFWSRETNGAVRSMREHAAEEMGIMNSSSVYGETYWGASPEERKRIDADIADAIAGLEDKDPKVKAANELFQYLLDTIDAEQGPLYDVVIRLTQWAADKEAEMVEEGVDPSLRDSIVNDRVQGGFLGLYEVYLMGKGLPTYE